MRLLHSTTLEFQDFANHEVVPYAILSHTWAEEEVLFQDIDGFNTASVPTHVKQKQGYRKIEACCAQAQRDGFEYVWIDTCCIDKRSSAELSEAINSMYRWYQDCTVCYAYLSDVPNNASPDFRNKKFRESRWFTRGWTVQELIGPLSLEFYGDQWLYQGQNASLGTKRSLRSQVSEITQIPEAGLLSSNLQQQNYSIAQKMSWAANRKTTRIEDRAYSLLGLLNVNMPLLYGEGNRAFIRLQEEIMKVSTDETLFAWRMPVVESRSIQPTGLLAGSLDYFASSGRITKTTNITRRIHSMVTNKGLRMEIMLPEAAELLEAIDMTQCSNIMYSEKVYIGVLNCVDEQSKRMIGILLVYRGPSKEVEVGEFSRFMATELVFINPGHYKFSAQDRTIIYARLAATYDPVTAVMDVNRRQKNLESQRRMLVVKQAPSEFQIVQGLPNGSWKKLEDAVWVTRLEAEAEDIRKIPDLQFWGNTEVFVVRFSFFAGSGIVLPRIEVLNGVGRTPEEVLSTKEFQGTSDRATCILKSERVVSASLRQEFWRQGPCYALRVAITPHSI
jgi:Heterokaryon incompatibility protein (HET)